MPKAVENMTPDEVRTFMAANPESTYELIDVRQPGEYQAGHIPGARLAPLGELQQNLTDLDPDRDLIFYCHSGARSASAALLAAEVLEVRGRVCNLLGGIMGWNGQTLPDFPPLKDFGAPGTTHDLLERALVLEKGAWLFYRDLADNPPENVICVLLDEIAEAKHANAREVYAFLDRSGDLPAFEEHFEGLAGDILAQGRGVEELAAWARGRPGGCPGLSELALALECRAYDLYRTLAGRMEPGSQAEAGLLTLAQRQKELIAHISAAVEQAAGIQGAS